MSTRRTSKRPSAVEKRRLLEEKLEKRKIESEVRTQKAQLKEIQISASEEAAQSSDLATKNLLDKNLDQEVDQSGESLDWDFSEDTPPSFSNENWNTDQAVEELNQEIDITSESSDADKENPLENKKVKSRRKTSTDNAFLDAGVDNIPPLHQFNWPPRLPSQEPEFIPLLHSSLVKNPRTELEVLDSDEEEFGSVFENSQELEKNHESEQSDESSPEEAAENTAACLKTILTPRF